jgi:2'-hydroxyisoflavone reductase
MAESLQGPPLKLLFLGGTGFIGPHLCRAAADRGHEVAAFNRGISAGTLPHGVERLTGDRDSDLASITDRDWDSVIDVAAFGPRWVKMIGEAMRDRVGHYTYISTVMTYALTNAIVNEDSPLQDYVGNADPYSKTTFDDWQEYGSLKVLAEREALAQFPKRTLIIRPGVISGPGDTADHAAFWTDRIRRGGEIAAPGTPNDPVQFIDVRDLAEWLVRMIERRETGTYNAVGPAEPLTFSAFLDACSRLFNRNPDFTWLPSDWLAECGVIADDGAPFFWVSPLELKQFGELWINYRVSSERAVAKGLRFRPIERTLSDNQEWLDAQPDERRNRLGSGWDRKEERALLAKWRATGKIPTPSGRTP